MPYFTICPDCKAHLDPGERCDCRDGIKNVKKESKKVVLGRLPFDKNTRKKVSYGVR